MRPLLLFALPFLAGCGTTSSAPTVTIPPAHYPAAFDAAKDTLASYRFELDRIDARAGVITTHPKITAGLATPWDLEQSTLYQETEDLLNDQRRTVRITFTPPEPHDTQLPIDDLRDSTAPFTATVQVSLQRLRRPGTRLEPSAIRFSSRAYDPDLSRLGLWPSHTSDLEDDRRLASRIAAEIRGTLPPRTTPRPATPVNTAPRN